MRRVLMPMALMLLACNNQPNSAGDAGGGDKASAPQGEQPQGEQPKGEQPKPSTDDEIGPGPQPEPLSAAVLDAPIPTEQPALDFWTKGDAACEAGGRLSGAAPPSGTQIRCVDEQGRWTGLDARFHENGQLQLIGRRQDSRMVGVWLGFHPNGTKATEQSYVDGQLHGTSRRWADNGQEIEYGEYRGGRPWGLFIHRDETGKELARSQLDAGTGVLISATPHQRSEADYVHGLLHGSSQEFDGSGRQLGQSTWSGGELHGVETRWNADGHKLVEAQWKAGKRHGQLTRYAGEQIRERSIWIDGEELARQFYRDGAPIAELPPASECDSNAGLSKLLEGARGRGLNEHACVTRAPLFPGVIMLGDFAYDRGCRGATFVVDCKLVEQPPSSAELLARAGWAKASGEQRIELAKVYVDQFAIGYSGSVTHEPDQPQWTVLDDGGVEGVIWVAEPAGKRPGVDKDQLRFSFAADGSSKRETLKHLSADD